LTPFLLVFDELGNLIRETDPNNNPTTVHEYDPLDRLIKTTDRLAGVTEYDYDVNDNLIQVKAPNNATTTYRYDDLGNQLQEVSPDRGTLTYTYDEAGNVKTKTDARSITATYQYDPLGRLTMLDLPGTDEDVTFTYDSCTLGTGRLCQISDQSGTTIYTYDAFGNIKTHTKTELGQTYSTAYTYDAADRIETITYPDGRTVIYNRDTIGRTQQIDATVNGTNTTITSNIQYRADGLLKGQTWGNGLDESRTYDLQGRLEIQSLGSIDSRTYNYDDNGNMLSKTRDPGSSPQTSSYTYDELDRLKTDDSPLGLISWQYDGVGNREEQTQDSQTETYTYQTNSNRLTQKGGTAIVTDPAGNITDNGTYTFTYNNAGRLYQVHQGSTLIATYTYNALGQRTRKVTQNLTTIYHYDLFGTLIAETTDTAQKLKAYLWHNGSPVAQIDVSGTSETLTYLHTDHLATARLATNAAGAIVWSWEGEAFGATLPDEDPDNDGQLTIINMRFPGQYFDGETGLHYNYFRYYDPGTGRYVSSDPIGLDGGVNTYVYVDSSPLSLIDPNGLDWIEYTGERVTLYSGRYGNRKKVKRVCKATSGLYYLDKKGNVKDYQNKSYQNIKDHGPVPEGLYSVNLSPDPSRTARPDTHNGKLLRTPVGGIEKIPSSFKASDGKTYYYPGWGTWRARLDPKKVPNLYKRSSFYLHNSHKGYTHGCVETCDGLANDLILYRALGNKSIDVNVKYTDPTTYGGTYTP
jgi:RHS repeat-associated protein